MTARATGSGSGVPAGGTTGQVLKKNSNTDGDASWAADSTIPNGGTAGQVLKKNSSTNGDASWLVDQSNPSVVAGGSLGATPSLDVSAQTNPLDVIYTGTLTANCVLTISNLSSGSKLKLLLTQDSTGGRTFQITVGASTVAISVNSTGSTLIDCVYDGTDLFVMT